MTKREAQNELCRSSKTPKEVYRITLSYERGGGADVCFNIWGPTENKWADERRTKNQDGTGGDNRRRIKEDPRERRRLSPRERTIPRGNYYWGSQML